MTTWWGAPRSSREVEVWPNVLRLAQQGLYFDGSHFTTLSEVQAGFYKSPHEDEPRLVRRVDPEWRQKRPIYYDYGCTVALPLDADPEP